MPVHFHTLAAVCCNGSGLEQENPVSLHAPLYYLRLPEEKALHDRIVRVRSSVERLRATNGMDIEGFTAEGRSFGGATCHLTTLFRSDEPHETALGAVIIPHRTHYRRVIEIIAPRFLREKLNLQDGDLVSMEVELEVAELSDSG